MSDDLTSLLDIIGLIAIALGVGVLVAQATSVGVGFIAMGVVIIAGSLLSSLLHRPVRSDE